MTLLTTGGSAILTPAQVQDLVIVPLIASSIAMQVATVVQTGSNETRFPIISADPSTSWVAEGAEIPVSDPDIDELVIRPPSLKGLTVVSNELVADSDPSALDVVGDGLVRDLRVKLDASFFGGAGVGVAPDGIESLAGTQTTTLAFSETGNLDPFAEAISMAETVGVLAVDPVTGLPGMSFVGHPTDVLSVATAKVATDSNAPLLGPDATAATSRSVLGVPLYSSPAVTPGIMWLVPRSKTFIVLRDDPEVIADTSAFFSSARTAVRAVLRVSPAFPHEQAVCKVVIDGGS